MKAYIFLIFALLCASAAQAKNLTVLNIVPLIDGHEKELAEDIVNIQKNGVADVSLAIFALAPQGNPPTDKPKICSERYKKLREQVGGRAKLGVLIQSSLGHGRAAIPKSFERVVSIQTLEEVPSKCCPMGENVKKYLKDACRQVALLKPDFVMIDDDFRMYCSDRLSGCLCPLHLKKISERLGREIGAKEAKARMNGTSPEDERVAAVIDEVITGSMLGLARELRASMDEVDPSIPCSIGTCDADIRYAKKIAEILAGKGNKPVVRINNARYAANNTTPRTFAKSMYKTAAQARDVEGCEIIAETDALPHCRYSTSARSLHANYCGYIFNGCRGAKHWITIISEFDPSMNAAYRKILAEHAKMYEALAENADAVVGAKGLATPLPSKPFYNMNPFTPGGYGSFTTWAQTVCNTTGIPANFAKIGAAPAMFGRGLLRMFTDEEIRRQLAIGMVLTGPAAAELCKRGYGKYLGVDAALCEKPSGLEKISADPINAELAGKFMSAGVSGFARLKPNSPKTRVLAEFMWGKSAKGQTPSATYFENELGGKIAVFGSEQTLDHFMFYMRYPRKDFFLKIFNAVSPFSFWYPHDAEVFVQTGTQKDGREFVCVYNFGWDPLEEIELGFSREPKSVKILGADGEFADAKFAVSGGVLKVKRKLEPMYPVFLKIGF